MKRIFGSLVASCLLLTGCGKLQSPDFEAVLMGLEVALPQGLSTATVAPSGTFKFTAIGLYSTPPGTNSSANTVSCGTSTPALCTRGTVTGVTWTADLSNGVSSAIASVDASGLATGLRRGNTRVRAKVKSFEASQPLTVDGPLLRSITVTPTPTNGTVAVGRNIELSAQGQCDTSMSNATLTDCDANYSWSLNPTNAGNFVGAAQGKTVTVKTARVGGFKAIATAVNGEGATISGGDTVQLSVTAKVLDSIKVVARSAAGESIVEPVPVIVGSPTLFVAVGTYSDGTQGDVLATDVAGGKLTWTADDAGVGKVLMKDDASANGSGTSNASTLMALPRINVSGTDVGATAITATGNSVETPTAVALSSRATIQVSDIGLLQVTRVCISTDVSPTCVIPPISQGSMVAFVALGRFLGESQDRVLDPTTIGMTWTSSAGSLVATDANTGKFTAATQGTSTITTTLKAGVAPTITDVAKRAASATAIVIDSLCRDEFIGTGATPATVAVDDTGLAPLDMRSGVAMEGNIIDNNSATSATVTLSSDLTTAGNLVVTVQRVGKVITTPAGGLTIGGLWTVDPAISAGLIQFTPINATGVAVGPATRPTSTNRTVNGKAYQVLTTNITPVATPAFTGLRIDIAVPSALGLLPLTAPPLDASLLNTLLALLGLGAAPTADIYNACADFNLALAPAP